MRGHAIEHGSSRGGRWLREHRLRLALWVAVAEAVLIVAGVIPKWPAVVIAVALIALHFILGRTLPQALRQVSWIAAASQALVALIPLLLFVFTVVAVVAVAALALVALAVLFADRR